MAEHHPYTVAISSSTIFKIIVVFLMMVFLYLTRDVILVLFLSLIFSSAVDPFIDWFEKYKVPRWLSMIFVYSLVFAFFAILVSQLIPAAQKEASAVAENFPQYYANVVGFVDNFNIFSAGDADTEVAAGELTRQIQQSLSPTKLFSAASGILGGVATVILILVLTFYMAVDDRGMKRALRSLAPSHDQPYVTDLVNRIQRKMGLWLRGQLLLSLIIFAVTWVGLLILDVPYSLLLALIAGIFEILPLFGPVLSALVAIFFVLANGDVIKVLLVAGLYIVVQQLENHIIVPKVMQKTTGLNPIVSIIALLIGFKLAGVAGGLIAIPVATAVSVIAGDVMRSKES